MNGFMAGFARIDITPPMGIFISGYYEPRNAEGVLDPLLASALAVSDGAHTAIIMSVDIIGMQQALLNGIRERIAIACGLERKDIFVACTHTHTGPETGVKDRLFPCDPVYNDRLGHLLAQAAVNAMTDMTPATMKMARSQAKGISFIRRFRMKDGTVRTNPGRHNPEIDHPIDKADESVQLVRILREGASEIDLINFQVHPDVISGSRISADYIKSVRDTMEGALPGVHCIYFNGAQGDLNHIDINCPEWDKNGGYEHSMHMGRVIAAAALSVYAKAVPVSLDGGVKASEIQLYAPANKGKPEQLPQARKYIELHDTGRDAEIPETGMGIVTLVAEAHRMLRLADGPDSFPLNLVCIRFGGICITGLPGEPFNAIGRAIKEQSPFDMQLICCCANGYEGYYPMQDAFDEGGYEARSSHFKQGIAEMLIDGSVKNIRSIH